MVLLRMFQMALPIVMYYYSRSMYVRMGSVSRRVSYVDESRSCIRSIQSFSVLFFKAPQVARWRNSSLAAFLACCSVAGGAVICQVSLEWWLFRTRHFFDVQDPSICNYTASVVLTGV